MPHLDGCRIDHAGELPRLERDARPFWESVGRGLEVDANVLVDDIKLLAIAIVGEPIPNREHGPPVPSSNTSATSGATNTPHESAVANRSMAVRLTSVSTLVMIRWVRHCRCHPSRPPGG